MRRKLRQQNGDQTVSVLLQDMVEGRAELEETPFAVQKVLRQNQQRALAGLDAF